MKKSVTCSSSAKHTRCSPEPDSWDDSDWGEDDREGDELRRKFQETRERNRQKVRLHQEYFLWSALDPGDKASLRQVVASVGTSKSGRRK